MKQPYSLQIGGVLTLLTLILGSGSLQAQNIGIGTVAPHASAALDIVSSSKGALLPRITEAARTGMGSPAPGLIVYQTDGSKPGFWYNAGTAAVPNWVRLTDSNGVSYDSVTGLQVGPGPVTNSAGPFTVGTATNNVNIPFGSFATSLRTETIYTAAELTAAGLHAGPITSVIYFVLTKNSSTPFTAFTISLGHTSAAATTTTFTAGLTQVYTGNLSTTLGDNTFPCTPGAFSWDGTSNLVLQTCYSAPSNGDDYAYSFSDNSNQVLYATGCATATGTLFAVRNVVRFSQSGSSYSLPPSAGATGQVLTMQGDGTAQWNDPAWYRNGIHAYRPYGPGTVAIGSTSTRTRLSLTPTLVEPKITLWDGGSTTNHYGFGISSSQLNYHVDGTLSNHVFWAGGKNGDGTELMRLKGNGFLTVGGAGANDSRLEIVNDGGGSGGADDIVIRSYGAAAGPGIALQRYSGSRATPGAVANGDYLGDIGFAGNTTAGMYFTNSSISSFYRGDGTNFLSDLYFKTSNTYRMRIDENGRVGIGFTSPQYPLHVNGTIAATTNQGVVLDAQDRPLITRGWDPFTSGNYSGLGRWGLFMEPYNLSFGVPAMGGRNFQWATYNLDSSIGSVLMMLSQSGYLGIGTATPGTRLDIVSDNLGGGSTDDVLLRSYSATANPAIGIRRYRGTRTAPQGLQTGDVMGTFGFSGLINGNENFFRLSGMDGYYRGDGTTFLSDLRLFTSNTERIRIEADGRVGIGNVFPNHQLDVSGNINGSRLYLTNTPALFYGSASTTNFFTGTTTLGGEAVSGAYNTSVGYNTGKFLTSASSNTLIGGLAGASNQDASDITAVGRAALSSVNGASADGNTAVGSFAGTYVTTGTGNTFLGNGADFPNWGQHTNATAIGYNAKVNADNALILGGTGTDAVNVGIGLNNPTYRLHIVDPTTFNRTIYAVNTSVGNSSSYALYGVSRNNDGYGYGAYLSGGYMGLWADCWGGATTGTAYGVYAHVSGTAGTRVGIYSNALANTGTALSYGIYSVAGGATTNYAGYFQGNVHVNGTLSKSAGTFRIDHPQDPENKYLVHSFVESPDMMNVYNGNVVTDAQGNANVTLPAYFEAENKDFKYQLTVIGQFAQAIIGQKVRNNQFTIRTDKPGVEVSWQVTGVRNDKYAQQNRIVAEVDKTGADKGKYLNPELYGRPASEGIAAPPAPRDEQPTARTGRE